MSSSELEPTDAGLDLAVHQTLAHGGAVWAIRHHQDLAPVEGIGAPVLGSKLITLPV